MRNKGGEKRKWKYSVVNCPVLRDISRQPSKAGKSTLTRFVPYTHTNPPHPFPPPPTIINFPSSYYYYFSSPSYSCKPTNTCQITPRPHVFNVTTHVLVHGFIIVDSKGTVTNWNWDLLVDQVMPCILHWFFRFYWVVKRASGRVDSGNYLLISGWRRIE